MSQAKKAKEFATLHVKGNPVILYNAWDAGSAKAIVEAGAKAIATSSWSVAAAQDTVTAKIFRSRLPNRLPPRSLRASMCPSL